MNVKNSLPRRDVLTGMAAGFFASACAAAAQKTAPTTGHAHMKDAAPAAPLSAEHQAVIAATADCIAAGRVCLARCTDHLAAGTPLMAECQRAVMNMLAVVQSMADVAGYANAEPKLISQLGESCASFCEACAAACKPHMAHHEECKACHDACLTCAQACRAV